MQGAPQQPRIDGYCAASGVRSSLALRWGWIVSLNLWGGVQPGLVYLPQIGLAAGGLTNNNNGYAGLICMQRVDWHVWRYRCGCAWLCSSRAMETTLRQ